MDIEKLNEKKASLLSKMEVIVDSADDTLTDEQQAEFDGYKADFDKTVKAIDTAEQLEKAKQDKEAQDKRPAPSRERIVEFEAVEEVKPTSATSIKLPASVRKSYNLKSFSGDDANEKAYSFGMFIRAANGDFEAARWCADHGINVSKFAVHNSTTNSDGGYLVPTVYSDDMAKLLNAYGVARQECKVINMTSDTFNRPKRASGLIAYPVAESASVTESTKSYGNIQLVVKDWSILTRMTRQLNQDALISVSDDLFSEIAYQFAYAEDNCLFNGDGTSTYASITGLGTAIATYAADPSTNPNVISNTATSGSVAISDITSLMGGLNRFSSNGAKWYCNSSTYYSELMKAAYGTSGTNVTNVVDGNVIKLMGKPVVFCDVLSDGIVYYGNMAQSVDFGDRAQYSIDFSDSAVVGGESVFEKNQIAVRGFERFDINVHSIGAGSELCPVALLTIS